jgi:RNAse (barnase) inhibitor barstar
MLLRLTKTSWQCVHFVASSVEPPMGELAAAGMYLAKIDVEVVHNKDDLFEFEILAKALDFPAYFGRNWDALEECLRDLDWLPANGYVIWLTGSAPFWRDNFSLAGTLTEVTLEVAQWWAERRIPFHLVFAGDG